jgi:hypothetical protein
VQHLKERKNWHITIFTLLMGISRVKHVERERERDRIYLNEKEYLFKNYKFTHTHSLFIF